MKSKLVAVILAISIVFTSSFAVVLSTNVVKAETEEVSEIDNYNYGSDDCNILPSTICDSTDNKKLENSGVWKILIFVLNVLTGMTGVFAVVGVVYGAVMYSSAGGSQEQIKKATGILQNVAIGVITYALMYSLLQWLIPGGIFN